jgi:predicted nucleotidyltransferase component of viral defense system
MSPGLAQSIQTRLVAHARTLGVDPNLVLARYATERLLYRLSRSRHAERFVLKGALLLLVWLGEAIRPTRDADLLGFGDVSDDELAATFAEICGTDVEPDGIAFDVSSIRVAAIRPEDDYGGQRVTLLGRLGPARLRVQVDVGVGDAVSPEPEWLEYPSLLDLPRPRLRAYRPETAIAEKVHAMVALGAKNSRMRDFFDVHALAMRESFDGDVLTRSLRATFERRRTEVPTALPLALTQGFADVDGKRAQWSGFVRRIRSSAGAEDLGDVIGVIAAFVGPALAAAAGDRGYPFRWPPGGPWTPIAAKEPHA